MSAIWIFHHVENKHICIAEKNARKSFVNICEYHDLYLKNYTLPFAMFSKTSKKFV